MTIELETIREALLTKPISGHQRAVAVCMSKAMRIAAREGWQLLDPDIPNDAERAAMELLASSPRALAAIARNILPDDTVSP